MVLPNVVLQVQLGFEECETLAALYPLGGHTETSLVVPPEQIWSIKNFLAQVAFVDMYFLCLLVPQFCFMFPDLVSNILIM